MQTTVVNLRREEYDVYIGPAGHEGYWCNPYRVGQTCRRCGEVHATGGETLRCFREYFLERVEHDEEFRRRLEELRGKRLGCFCKPGPCHGDVIAEFVDNALRARRRRVREDVAALERIRASRALSASSPVRGSRYILGDDEYEVYRVTRRAVVLRNIRRLNSFITSEVSGPLDPKRWR